MNAQDILEWDEEDEMDPEEMNDHEFMFRIALCRLEPRELGAVLFKLDVAAREIEFLEKENKKLRKKLDAKKAADRFGDIHLPDLP